MKSRLLSPFAFLRLPLIAWDAPKALRSDMSGPTLLGLFGALATAAHRPPRSSSPTVCRPPRTAARASTSPTPRRRVVARFLKG